MRGAVAGSVATVAMSVPMLVARRLGYLGEPPPEQITDAAFDAAGADPPEPAVHAAATVAHLGFGVGMGALFTLLGGASGRSRVPLAQGAGYGLLVWAVSYQGWVPALGILPPASDDRRDRVSTMALAHVVYGAVLATVSGHWAQTRSQSFHTGS